MSLNYVLDKLNTKAKSFKDLERIAKFIAKHLTDAAPEVWSEARTGINKLKDYLEPWDLDLLLRWALSEKEYDHVISVTNPSKEDNSLMVTNSRSKSNFSESKRK